MSPQKSQQTAKPLKYPLGLKPARDRWESVKALFDLVLEQQSEKLREESGWLNLEEDLPGLPALLNKFDPKKALELYEQANPDLNLHQLPLDLESLPKDRQYQVALGVLKMLSQDQDSQPSPPASPYPKSPAD